MFTEAAIASLVRPAVLGRGRTLAKRAGRIWDCTCSYDGPDTLIEGNVDSSSGYRDSYRVSASFDEDADLLVSYACNCPAAYNYPGPCKHVVALCLDFIAYPAAFEGHNPTRHVKTSRALGQLLDRMTGPTSPRRDSTSTEGAGTVHLEPTLALTTDDTLLSLKIRGSNGAYVVKSIGDLVDRTEDHEYHEYGKKLAFTHEERAFCVEDVPLLHFLQDAVHNRRAFAAGTYGYYGYGRTTKTSTGRDLRLSTPELDRLFGLYVGRDLQVIETGAHLDRSAVPRSLHVEDGEPQLSLSFEPASDGAWRIVRGEGWHCNMLSTGRHLYLLGNGKILRCPPAMQEAGEILMTILGSREDDLLMTGDDTRRFVATALPRIERVMQVEVPPEVESMRPDPLRVRFYLDRDGRAVTCDAVACYGSRRFDLCGRGGERVGEGEQAPSVSLVRDHDGEHAARQVVQRYFFPRRNSRLLATKTDADSVARAIFEGVGELARVGEVLATDAFSRLARSRRPSVRVGVSVGSGLIDLSVSSDDLPPRELSALLASYRQKKRYHRLRDGSFLSLEGADLDEAARLADELDLSSRDLASGHAHIPSYKAFLLDALVPDEEKDDAFLDYVEGFRSVDPQDFVVPAPLAGRLRGYQEEGFRWLCALSEMGFGGILADEMGLGKSVQLISFLLSRRGRGPALVVCPASLVYNWLAEFEKFAPGMDVVAVAGTAEERRRMRGEMGHEVFVSSYDLVRRDVEDWARLRLWCVVLDEAQYIKNQQTLAAQAVKALDAQHRFALTGTPIENRLSEMWSIFDFLMPGLLGSYERFRERYEEAIAGGDDEVAARLRAAVEPFILRRLKRDVLADLPDKLERVVACRMAPEQRRLYAAREQALRSSLAGSSEGDFATGKLQVLAELTRLRQLCCDPSLVYEGYTGGAAKLDTILQLVDSAVEAGEKVLVFSQFTSFLSRVAIRLDKAQLRHYEITGQTPKRRRLELVDAFNANDVPVFLVSLKAGGTGLNLVGASVVIHADPWWNSAAQDQATDRAHRIGQTRDVSVYKVICTNTIEERIVDLQEAKAGLAEAVVGEGGGGTVSLASLRREDLLELLGE